MLQGSLYSIAIEPIIVDEQGAVYLAQPISIIQDEGAIGRVQLVLIAQAAGRRDGIVPLDPQAIVN